MRQLLRKFRRRDREKQEELSEEAGREITLPISDEVYLLQKYRWIVLANQSSIHYHTEPRMDPHFRCLMNTFDYEDILQESFLSFEEAIENYNEQKNSSFLTYFTTCLNNQLLSLVRQQSRQKRQILLNQISLDNDLDEDNNHNQTNYEI